MDPVKWSVDDVCKWVDSVAGSEWAEIFETNSILGADLLDMDVKELSLILEDEEVSEMIHMGICQLRRSRGDCDASNGNVTLTHGSSGQIDVKPKPPSRSVRS